MNQPLATFPALLEHTGKLQQSKPVSLPQLLWVMAAGYLHALSLAWPFGLGLEYGKPLWWLQLTALAMLVWQLGRNPRAGRAALLGWLFATAMLCGTFWWLFISMHRYGGLAAPLAVLAVLGLAGFLALYYAVACGVYAVLAPTQRVGRVFLFAAMWLLAELARVRIFTGFPWGEAGYAHIDGWARPLAGWVGVHGLSFLAAFTAALFVVALQGARPRWLLALATLAAAVGLAQLPAPQPTAAAALRAPLQVTLLQGNIPQNEKFQSGTGVVDALQFYGQQLQLVKSPLVVLPETALPMLPHQLPEAYWERIKSRFTAGQQAVLIGIPLGSSHEGYTNSVLGFKPEAAEPYRYDKHHLVPFGEFVPPFFKWFTRLMNIPLGDFNRGAVGQTSFDWMGERLAPNICYEDLFGEELGARFHDPAKAPTIFVNVSNIGWFGNTIAIDQHLHISRMRALEFARPMIRATNTGATVVIDRQGRLTYALERHTRGVLVAEVQGVEELTFYATWVSRLGLWPWWAIGLLIGLGALANFHLSRRSRGLR